jgi:small subunit ribosomal protein S20
MPNIKSAIKRVRTTERQTTVNRRVKTRVSSARRSFGDTVQEGSKEAAQKAYDTFASALDKAAKAGVIKKNTADRSKSRAHKTVARMA